jgi:hypothetical protein
MCCAHSVCAMVWLYAPTRTSSPRTCSRAENFCCRQTSSTMSPGVALNPNLETNMTSGSEPLNPPPDPGTPTQGMSLSHLLVQESLLSPGSCLVPYSFFSLGLGFAPVSSFFPVFPLSLCLFLSVSLPVPSSWLSLILSLYLFKRMFYVCVHACVYLCITCQPDAHGG